MEAQSRKEGPRTLSTGTERRSRPGPVDASDTGRKGTSLSAHPPTPTAVEDPTQGRSPLVDDPRGVEEYLHRVQALLHRG